MNILIVDDHELFSYSLKLVIENQTEQHDVTTCSTSTGIEDILKSKDIEIILLDINLKSENGLAIGETLKKRVPQIPLVFLTGFDLAEYRTQAKKLHAEGFLNKNIHPTKLLEKLKTIIENGPIAIENEKEILTEQEKKILQLLGKGFTQDYIASNLYISRRTVNNHVQSIHEKLKVSSTIEAISEGIKLGIVPLNYK
ncbi:DNA-binding response regulator [Tetragenococcus halophilus]|uniref:DNA-binding response regulator n=1 Tax=Tetragenococcus halophilus TaxID=51669 RepID=A0A3G5FKZ8_TETHA|nr:response regulator transcription factor [Tetragenococcus halophilus]AYW51027.1 DNA-binding response regulator [Tetragenococcus halophilus]GBD64356.1 hypothetical protein TEHD23766T_1783 [Tetragenococcus halophilus subsp. flandriensis]